MITRFRLNRFGLRVDEDKHLNVSDRICTLCTTHNIEDQFHVLSICKAYNGIRFKYFGYYYLNYDQFITIMSSNCERIQMKTVQYLKEVTSIRNENRLLQ